jgi:hypothetical protein
VGFHGSADIVGAESAVLSVLLCGADVHLRAMGQGWVVLWGEGTYQTGPDETLHSWGKSFMPIRFGGSVPWLNSTPINL